MTVIQKCSRGEMVKLIQDRMMREIGGARSTERIEQDLIVMEAVGLISFPPEGKYDDIIERDVSAIHAAAMQLSSTGTMSGSGALAMIYDLVKAGFHISRDKIASEEEIAHALFDQMLFVPVTDPANGGQTLRGMIEPEGAQLIVRHLRDMGFEIVKTG